MSKRRSSEDRARLHHRPDRIILLGSVCREPAIALRGRPPVRTIRGGYLRAKLAFNQSESRRVPALVRPCAMAAWQLFTVGLQEADLSSAKRCRHITWKRPSPPAVAHPHPETVPRFKSFTVHAAAVSFAGKSKPFSRTGRLHRPIC